MPPHSHPPSLQFFVELAYCHQWATGKETGTQLNVVLSATSGFKEDDFRESFAADPALFYLTATAFAVPVAAFSDLVQVSCVVPTSEHYSASVLDMYFVCYPTALFLPQSITVRQC